MYKETQTKAKQKGGDDPSIIIIPNRRLLYLSFYITLLLRITSTTCVLGSPSFFCSAANIGSRTANTFSAFLLRSDNINNGDSEYDCNDKANDNINHAAAPDL